MEYRIVTLKIVDGVCWGNIILSLYEKLLKIKIKPLQNAKRREGCEMKWIWTFA